MDTSFWAANRKAIFKSHLSIQFLDLAHFEEFDMDTLIERWNSTRVASLDVTLSRVTPVNQFPRSLAMEDKLKLLNSWFMVLHSGNSVDLGHHLFRVTGEKPSLR